MSKSFLKRLKANPEYFEFWEDLHDYCKDLHIPNKQEFVDTLPILYKRIKNDGAGHDIFQGLNKFAIEKPEDAIDILARIEKKGTREVLEFSASILSGLSQSETTYSYENKILEFVKSKDENKIYSGIEAAYRMRFKDKKEEVKFLNLIHIKIKGNRKSKSARCLGITTRFYNKHLNTIEEAKAIIIYLLESKNFSVQSEVARSLNEEFKPDEDIEHFKKCLNLLTYTDTKHQGIYSTIRFRLKEITKSHPNIILDFIEIWVLNNKENLKSISALEGVIEELYITNPETLKKMFLDWLNSDNSLYKYAVPFIISNLKFESIGLHKESLKKVSETDSIYIAYMIVGHILDRKYATEMLYSILEVKYNNERVKNHIATIFVKYLIINFYSVTEILQKKSKSANKTIKSIIKQIINTSEQYYQRVSELKVVNEYEPSDKRMQYFMKQQGLHLQKLMDGSERKRDSILDLFTNVNLRAGKSFFAKHNGVYSQESEMQSFKSSFEVPRVQSIDEIGQEKLRLMWQNRKRDEFLN